MIEEEKEEGGMFYYAKRRLCACESVWILSRFDSTLKWKIRKENNKQNGPHPHIDTPAERRVTIINRRARTPTSHTYIAL